MAVENKIVQVKNRHGVRVPFTQETITDAILRAAQSIGGFAQDIIPGTIYGVFRDKSDEDIARLLSDDVVLCLNSNKSYMSGDFPPDVEAVQDQVVHVLRSRGFVDTADVYEVYRWGRAKVRNGELPKEQFAANGFPDEQLEELWRTNVDNHCETVQKINAWVLSGKFRDLVEMSIAAYDAQIDNAVKLFLEKKNVRIILVTGPSSSGKTTTTTKFEKRLAKFGHRFRTLNLDDYFLGIEEYPRDSFGDWDFETPQALRLDLINRHLSELLEGNVIKKPVYDFQTGKSIPEAEELSIEKDEILLLDSLHGLYPPMTSNVPDEMKFKFFIEAMSMVKLGDGEGDVFTKGTDVRMLRRMLRDRDNRNHSPAMTLGHWHFVRKGELRDMIPYIRTVDVVVNGGLPFELPVLKKCISEDFPSPRKYLRQGRFDAYIRGERVRRLLESIVAQEDVSTKVIPADCHLREFIGGGNF